MSIDLEQRYDEIPYLTLTFVQTHPDRLAGLGMLCGLDPVPPVRARVLEIGCSDGGNLIPLACALPEAQFLGFDLSSQAVARGQRAVQDLGLKNIELRHADILTFDAAEGPFDYVIAHGMYSWVPDHVRARLVELIRAALAPQGLAFVSYMVNPGGYLMEMMRQIMLYHVRDIADPAAQVKAVRALLDVLPGFYPDNNENLRTRSLFEREVESLRRKPDSILLHDDLSPVVHREWYWTFREKMDRRGLRVIADARWSKLANQEMSQGMRRWLDGVSPDPEIREQYRDILLLARYREDILCRADAPATQAPALSAVARLRFRAAVQADGPLDLAPKRAVKFKFDSGGAVTLDGVVVKAALGELGRAYPWSIGLDELYERARTEASRSGVAPEGGRDDLANALFHMLDFRLVQATTFDPPFARMPGERPVASPLARYQARKGSRVNSLLHNPVQMKDDRVRRLLGLLDGTRDRAALAHEWQATPEELDAELNRLQRTGLLVA